MTRRGVSERFVDAFVGVLQVDVFPDDRDLDLLLRVDDATNELPPVAQIGRRRVDLEQLANEFVETFLVQHERHLVNRVRHIARLDDRVRADVAEHGKFLPDVGIERAFGAANQDLRLKTDLAQLRDALLRRLGLQFARRPDVGHERDVHVDDILRADFENELPDRLEKRQPFDVADRAADFGDDDVDFFRIGDLTNARLDFIGDVRDHLHGLAEIIAAPFFQDNALVNLAARQVVVPREDAIGEAFVMAEIEIGFGAVVQDVNFTVLKRVHRPGIDVEIGIEFLQEDALAAQLEQGAEGSGREAFA